MVAEMERRFIRERQQAGIEAAKAKVAPPPHDPTSGIRAKRLVHTPFFFT